MQMRRDQGGDTGDERSISGSFSINGVLVSPGELSLKFGEEEEVRLEPKVMAVLEALAERPGRAWKREDLIDRVWGKGEAGDESLTRAIYRLRKVLGPHIGENALLTLPRLGYRLNTSIERAKPADVDFAPDPFSIAVLPISDQTRERAQPHLTDGLTRDLTALLSRTPRFRVAPISSTMHHATNEDALPALARKLDVRFMTKGSLVRYDQDIRIRIELIDFVENALIWSRKYEAHLDRFFEVQDDAVIGIATAVSAKIRVPHKEPTRRNKLFNISAYERVQQAESLRCNYSRTTADSILILLEEALAAEPEDTAVAAALAVQLSQHIVSGWVDDPVKMKRKADAIIKAAISESPQDPDVLAAAGVVATMFHRPDEAIDYLERCLANNPNDAHALAVLGWQRCLRHADPNGVSLIEIAEERAPHHPRFGLWATYRATAHLFMLDYEPGLAAAREAARRTPNYFQPLLHCAWAHVGLGDPGAACEAIRKADAIEPDVLPKYIDEMRKWSSNSPHKIGSHEVLARLLALGPEAKHHCARKPVVHSRHSIAVDIGSDR